MNISLLNFNFGPQQPPYDEPIQYYLSHPAEYRKNLNRADR